jgi:DNA-binding CsgD family transcriptional regulator
LLVSDAETLLHAGRPLDALADVRRTDVSTPRLAVLAAVPGAAALAMTGRTAEALASSRRAYADQVQLGDALGLPSPGVHRINELFALVQAGFLTEAAERGRAWIDDATRSGQPLDAMWLAVHLARGALAQGKPRTALRWADRADRTIDAHRVEGLRPLVATVRAVAHGLLGHAPAGAEAADQIGRFGSGCGHLAVEWPLGRASALAATGNHQQARKELIAAADDAERVGCVPSAAWLLHDAIRLGAADEVATRLGALAASTDSQLVARWSDHASAVVADDAPRLATVSGRLAAIGAVLVAAEAAAEAAEAWRRAGDDREAAAANQRAVRLAARCEGASTPVLLRARTVAALTERELAVAALAAEGHSSRAIGQWLSLSARTVDNHLGRVYAKVGVSSRAELAAAFHVAPGARGG